MRPKHATVRSGVNKPAYDFFPFRRPDEFENGPEFGDKFGSSTFCKAGSEMSIQGSRGFLP